jgi:hypothetical protein
MMKSTRSLFALVLTLLFLPTAAGATDFPTVDGWTLAGKVTAKAPDTLWEFNNGAAEAFLSYGFQGLRYADLKAGEVVVTVEIYDMAAPINAFGIYTTERSDDAERVKIGTEAVLALPYQCLLLKDRNYLKLSLYQGELKREQAETLLRGLAGALPGSDTWPDELGLLPAKDQVAGTVGFTREAYLGMSVLRECVHAEYPGREKPFQRFTILGGSDDARKAAWDKLAARWTAAELKGKPLLWKEIPYQGITGVLLTEKGIFGVSDCADEKEMLKRLGAFL